MRSWATLSSQGGLPRRKEKAHWAHREECERARQPIWALHWVETFWSVSRILCWGVNHVL
jgi:hypothetical protein